MMNMDLVITVDTSLAHLAGAFGKEVWVVLSRMVDSRWMFGRKDTPWYPTMRLFRQQRLDRWGSVFEKLRSEVKQLLKRRGTPAT